MTDFRRFTEHPDNPHRLGRHQVHSALVAELDAEHSIWRRKLVTTNHREVLPVFDQGQLGSCTANAALGCLVTAPFAVPGVAFTEDDAVALYEAETKLDDSQIPGHYPPDDTGSSGPWSMQALQQAGLIQTWRHTRSTHTALQLLLDGPISIGVAWYQSMFTPDADNVLEVFTASGIAGGHQVCVTALDVERQCVLIRNSWGESWGVQGHAWLKWSDLDSLLAGGGDVVQPVVP